MRPLRIFYSYSHRDEPYRDELAKHLTLLRRAGVIEEWHDRRIAAGAEWGGEIDRHLERADIVLLLVSADFLASDYCFDIEMKRALERHDRGSARVIPILVRSVSWREAPFARLQMLPSDGKAIDGWKNSDAAWTDIAEGISAVIEEFKRRPPEDETAVNVPTRLRAVFKNRTPDFVLLEEEGLEAGRQFKPEPGDKLIIGRGDEADVKLSQDDRRASRYHAWVEVTRSEMLVHDLKSKNGLYVNANRVSNRELRKGDRIRCGRTVLLVQEVPDPDRTVTERIPRLKTTAPG